MADLKKLVDLGTLQQYINRTIQLTKDNFAKKNMTVTNIELVNEVVPPDTEKKNYLKITYVDDGVGGQSHVVYNKINVDLGSESGDTGATADWVTNITAGGLASGTDVTGLTALEIVKKITRKYANATCSVTWAKTDSLVEQGTTFNLIVTVNNFRNGDYAPSKVALYEGSTLIEQKTVSGTTINFTTINNISTNKTYSVKLTDANNVTTTVASKTYTFAYPIYYGVVNNGATLDDTAIKGLSKVLSSATTITQSFTANFQTIVFATTKNLTDIVNQNGYSVLGNATKQTVLIDGTNFNVYTLANINVTNFKYDFKF